MTSPFRWGHTERGRRLCCDDDEVLDLELERALVFWTTRSGPHKALHTREDWAWAWLKWADVLLPKVIEFLPGRRPAAMYAAGIIPPRPFQQPIPLAWKNEGLLVADRAGGGTTFYDLPAPWQRAEVLHLRDLGVVDDAEFGRWQASRASRQGFYLTDVADAADDLHQWRKTAATRAADDYVFEVARFR